MKLKTRIKRLKKRLGKKALRDPKSKSQIRDRMNYDRVNNIWSKRYE
jgi:cytidylate kinase